MMVTNQTDCSNLNWSSRFYYSLALIMHQSVLVMIRKRQTKTTSADDLELVKWTSPRTSPSHFGSIETEGEIIDVETTRLSDSVGDGQRYSVCFWHSLPHSARAQPDQSKTKKRPNHKDVSSARHLNSTVEM